MGKSRNPSSGVTLTELMIAVAIMSIGILGFIGSFQYISRSLHVSRTRTLATNLAQEKIEYLKNLSYYDLLITTTTGKDPTFGFFYDALNYTPETIAIGGVTFTRYTLVSMAQITNNVVTAISSTYPDTGLKQITVDVVWMDNGAEKVWSLTNLLENPNVSSLASTISGTVKWAPVSGAGGGNLAGAVVSIQELPGINSLTDSNGSYTFSVPQGSYTVSASSVGYYNATSTATNVAQGAIVTMPTLTLVQIGSGTIAGNAWTNPTILISQVVASTDITAGNYDVQYIELYNPTTSSVFIGNSSSHTIKLNFISPAGNQSCSDLQLTYVNTSIPSYGYYLIANTGTITTNGTNITPDARYTYLDSLGQLTDTYCSGNCNCSNSRCPGNHVRFPCETHSGTVSITDSSNNTIDAVGWDNGSTQPNGCEGGLAKCIPFPNGGFVVGEQIVRISSPLPNLSVSDMNTYGHAYNSQINQNDFYYALSPASHGIQFSPRNSTSATMPPIAGVPAVGAIVNSSDFLSGSTQAYTAYITSGSYNLAYAPFTLIGVSTTVAAGSCAGNCWNVTLTTGTFWNVISTVSVTQGVTTWIPNANTVPGPLAANVPSVLINSAAPDGFVTGQILDLNNNPLSGIEVLAGGVTKYTAANGVYFMELATGPVTIIVNPNNVNPNYTEASVNNVVTQAAFTTNNIQLAQGGALEGYLTSGTTPLPNQYVAATISGFQYGSAGTNTSGIFIISNLSSTGTYTVAPILNSGQNATPVAASPAYASGNSIVSGVTAGKIVFIGTFTVTGASGGIIGSVTNNGSAVTTGALIVASTSSLSSTPPAIVASSSTSQTPIYAVSTIADGTYSLSVNGGYTYNISAYVPSISASGGISISTKTYTGVVVNAGLNTTKNISLP